MLDISAVYVFGYQGGRIYLATVIKGEVMNAAEQLATLFREWNENRDESLYKRRGHDSGPVSLEFWRLQRNASDLMSELEDMLELLNRAGIRTSRYDHDLARWWSYVWSVEIAWQSGNINWLIDESSLGHLESISDIWKSKFPEMDDTENPVDRDKLRHLLNDASEVASECSDIPRSIQIRLAHFIEQLSTALDPDTDINPLALQRALDQLSSTLLSAMNGTNDFERKKKLFVIAASFSNSLAQNATYDALKQLASAGFEALTNEQ